MRRFIVLLALTLLVGCSSDDEGNTSSTPDASTTSDADNMSGDAAGNDINQDTSAADSDDDTSTNDVTNDVSDTSSDGTTDGSSDTMMDASDMSDDMSSDTTMGDTMMGDTMMDDTMMDDMMMMPDPNASAGCGQSTMVASDTWEPRMANVNGTMREYFVRLPANYDPTRTYPIVYQWHGCSDNQNRQNNNVPVQNQSGDQAIHVRAKAAMRCFDTSANGEDVAFFDALLPAVEGEFCVNTSLRYASGYSGGGFMAHRLACARGDQLKAVATIAGGMGGNNCTGTVAALLIHDTNDNTVPVSASINARDAHLMRNGCDTSAGTTPTNHPPCVSYDGCPADKPVVWCETTGNNHSRQDSLAAPAFWDFFTSLP